MSSFDDWPEELQHVFEDIESAAFTTEDEYAEFAELAEDLFYTGWVNVHGADGESIQAARDEFFALLDEYDISIDVFDWDDWRDWYTGA